ncbi:MAG TPA: succinate dehydrogenase iron-sulfur subunit [Candidatus Thermoplasmatota archaeon]|nr:succinate dehydrogenase iron-sulfur subunit [Candidatus Thermoplasmatota archaeon]
MVQVTFKVRRFNPETDEKPYWQEAQLDVPDTERVVDVLRLLKGKHEGWSGLAFRASCVHGICGSDAMLINGINRLACKTLVRDVGTSITVEPIKGLPVKRDLLVDMEPFFASYKALKPWLITNGSAPQKERLQSPEDREVFDDTTKCILCGACTTSCPSFWANGEFLGPATIVNAHRFIFDSRDQGSKERLEILNQKNGIWRCRTIFNCTDACPRDIQITKAIGQVKKAIMFGKA